MAKELKKTVLYRSQFIDSARYMASSISNLVNNLAEGIHTIKYECKYCDYFLEYTNFKD